jgi:hypothetical protein
MGFAELWDCIRCGAETLSPQIVRGRAGMWVAVTTCASCSTQNFHTKTANYIVDKKNSSDTLGETTPLEEGKGETRSPTKSCDSSRLNTTSPEFAS